MTTNAKNTAAKKAAPKADTKAPAKAAPEAKVFTLADLARDLEINPKIARAKARRNDKDFNKLRVKGEENHWVFPIAKRDAVSRLLQA